MDYLCYHINHIEKKSPDINVLTEEEQAFPPLRKMARLMLKQELSRRSGHAPSEIKFTPNEHGKPFYQDYHFNVSHSGEMICLAFHSDEIGVDIQKENPRINVQRLASKIMCEEQLAAFREHGAPLHEFFQAWCVLESLVKCMGSTVWKATDYPFILYPNRVKLNFPAPIAVELFTPAEGYYGAVAYKLQACTDLP